MSDKTIAEIIGWTEREVHWVDEGDVACSAVVPFGPDGERRYAQHGPTVDDLVDWLVPRGIEAHLDVYRYKKRAQVYWAVTHDDLDVDGVAPSVLGAFESAVRAVAGAS